MIYTRQDLQNRSVHVVATSIVFDQVLDKGLPESGPQHSRKDCNVHQLVDINQTEFDAISDRYRIHVSNILFEHFPAFAMFRNYLATSTSCEYPNEMASNSAVLTMPVVMKNEKKYSDCVDVLDQLENGHRRFIRQLDYVPENLNQQLEPLQGLTNLLPMSPLLHLTVIHCMV